MITTAERARPSIPSQCVQPRLGRLIKRHPTMVSGIVLLGLMVLMAVGAPYWGTLDPLELNPIERLYAPDSYPQGYEQEGEAAKRSRTFEEQGLLMVCVSCNAQAHTVEGDPSWRITLTSCFPSCLRSSTAR